MNRHALYRFFDAEGSLLYVGITNHPDKRFRSHREKDRWGEIASITIQWCDTREDVLAAEKLAIQTEHPQWNIVFNAAPVQKQRTAPVQKPKPVHTESGLFEPGQTVGLATVVRRRPLAHVGVVLRSDRKTVTIRTPEGDERTLGYDRVQMSRVADLESVQQFKADWEYVEEWTPEKRRRVEAFLADPHARGPVLR